MTEKKKPPTPIPLCRFEELATRENRLREKRPRKRGSRDVPTGGAENP